MGHDHGRGMHGMKGTNESNGCAACGACDGDGRSRRSFLGLAAGGLLGVLALLGLPADALALPILMTSADPATSNADEKRYPIPTSDSVNIDHAESLIVVRLQGQVYVFNLACPHQQAAVKWVAVDNRFQCTKHDSRYTPQGVYISGHATRNLDRFPIKRDGNQIVVDLDHMVQSDKDPAGWQAATITAG
jgi:nitrite reductase/ring-hydroxylating ferredoxin subunit